MSTPCPFNPHVSEDEFAYALRGAEVQARRLVRRYGATSLEVEDLEQYARIGVLHAARRFDPSKGVLFTTYAFTYAWGYAARGERAYHPLPMSRRQRIKAAETSQDPEFCARYGRRPHEEAACSLADLLETHEPAWDGGIGSLIETFDLRAELDAALATLAPETARLLWAHHGEGRSVRSLALEHGIPPESLRQRLKRARAELRKILAAKLGVE